MNVQVMNRLSAIIAGVYHQSKTALQLLFHRNLAGSGKEMSDKRSITYFQYVFCMPARNHQNMRGRLRKVVFVELVMLRRHTERR